LIQVSTPVRCATIHVLFRSGGINTATGIHLSAESLDLFESEVGCATHGLDAGGPWGGAIGIEVGMKDYVGGGVQVALGVTALG
jgi:hypothetical protein